VLSWLPTLDESGVAFRQTGGRDPHRGIRIPGVPAGGSQPADAGFRATPASPNSLDKGKGAAGNSSSPGAIGRSEGERRHRLRRADGSFISDPPLDSDPAQKRQRTASGTVEAGSQTQGAEARQSFTTTIINLAATATATIVRFTAASPGAVAASTAAAAAGAANVPLPVSLEGPGPQVSVPPFYFLHWFSHHIDGY
jgi:hypothetical protein